MGADQTRLKIQSIKWIDGIWEDYSPPQDDWFEIALEIDIRFAEHDDYFFLEVMSQKVFLEKMENSPTFWPSGVLVVATFNKEVIENEIRKKVSEIRSRDHNLRMISLAKSFTSHYHNFLDSPRDGEDARQ